MLQQLVLFLLVVLAAGCEFRVNGSEARLDDLTQRIQKLEVAVAEHTTFLNQAIQAQNARAQQQQRVVGVPSPAPTAGETKAPQ